MEDAPQAKYTKRLLPPYLTSETPNGPINKTGRSAGERAALEKRKKELLQSMTREHIEAEYSGQAVKINEYLGRKARKNADIDEQLANLKDEHDMEMRVIKANLTRQDEKREADVGHQGVTSGKDNDDAAVRTEARDDEQEEGEIEMTG